MAKITGITCNHVKGINHLDVPCDFYPNKPNFLVAPSGSGKSSLATAFAGSVEKVGVEPHPKRVGPAS